MSGHTQTHGSRHGSGQGPSGRPGRRSMSWREQPISPRNPQPWGPHRRPMLLVVDDDRGVRESLNALLGLAGYGVDTAADGMVALGKMQHRTYDLILSDLYMPRLNGMGLYRVITQDYPHLRTPILFLVGDASRPDLREFLAQTPVPLLMKPCPLE